MRLNKYISDSGFCSRREADRFIERGQVFINGVKAILGDQVRPGDKIVVNNHKLNGPDEKELILLAFNKPVGIESTTDLSVRDNIIRYIHHPQRIFPIGRLDKDSQGLIFLTNEGDLVNKILRAGNRHEKEYLVTVDREVTEEFVKAMSSGVPVLGQMTRRCKVSRESHYVFRIILVQGLNRQIRRMCEHFGYEVMKLERIRIMNITLKGIPVGDWRELKGEELNQLMALTADSSKDAVPAKSKPKSSSSKGTTSKATSPKNSSSKGPASKGSSAKSSSSKDPGPKSPSSRSVIFKRGVSAPKASSGKNQHHETGGKKKKAPSKGGFRSSASRPAKSGGRKKRF